MTIEWVADTGHFLPEERPEVVVERARELFAGPHPGAPGSG
jgi:pimeloyl-ACP methyl ester carboxylesterase